MADVLYKITLDEVREIQFEYQALPTGTTGEPHIRLLTLFPGTAGSSVFCSLTSHIWRPKTGFVWPAICTICEGDSEAKGGDEQDLSVSGDGAIESLAYEALSYTWGGTDQFYSIEINGRAFPVTRNVLQALFYLRRRDRTRTLWIDAICINQADEVDKNYQIRQMHHIYQRAYRVVVWLGISTRNSDLAFDFMEELYDCFSPEAKQGSEGEVQKKNNNRPDSEDLVARTRHLMVGDKAREWLALHWLFKRPYWARAWIFQEFLMARETIIMCGPKAAKWGPVDSAMRIVQRTGYEIRDLINSSGPIKDQQTLSPTGDQNPHSWTHDYNMWLLGLYEGRHYMKYDHGRASSSQTMERWLSLINRRLCKFQHDKVYSILGIMSEPFARLVPDVDYSRPAQDVFKQTVRAFIQGTGSLNILCLSQHADTQDDLPSWTFDWRRRERLHFIHDIAWGIGSPEQRTWHASALAQHAPQFSQDLTSLSVHGIALGVVQYTDLERQLLPGCTQTSKDESDKDAYGNPTCHHSSHVMQRWCFDEDTAEALGLILRPHSPLILEDALSTLLYLLLLRRDPSRLAGSSLKSQSPEFSQALQSGDMEVVDILRAMTKCRIVVETDTLELALAPFWTRPGDVIRQLVGCTAPVVLRPREEGRYGFIGDCYVFQKMGQIMVRILKQAIKTPGQLERFVLV